MRYAVKIDIPTRVQDVEPKGIRDWNLAKMRKLTCTKPCVFPFRLVEPGV